jgi:hypothetical protein
MLPLLRSSPILPSAQIAGVCQLVDALENWFAERPPLPAIPLTSALSIGILYIDAQGKLNYHRVQERFHTKKCPTLLQGNSGYVIGFGWKYQTCVKLLRERGVQNTLVIQGTFQQIRNDLRYDVRKNSKLIAEFHLAGIHSRQIQRTQITRI